MFTACDVCMCDTICNTNISYSVSIVLFFVVGGETEVGGSKILKTYYNKYNLLALALEDRFQMI